MQELLEKIKCGSNSLKITVFVVSVFATVVGKITKNLTVIYKAINTERDLFSVCFTNVLNHNLHHTDEQREAEQKNRKVRLLRYNLAYPSLEFKVQYSQFVDITF